MRHLHKSWQDKRSGWTRRVRWYQYNPGFEGIDIRLEFTDETGVKNEYFTDSDTAQHEFDAFKTDERQLYK